MIKKIFLPVFFIGAFFAWANVADAGSLAEGKSCQLGSADCAAGLFCRTSIKSIGNSTGYCSPQIADGDVCTWAITYVSEKDKNNCKYGCKSTYFQQTWGAANPPKSFFSADQWTQLTSLDFWKSAPVYVYECVAGTPGLNASGSSGPQIQNDNIPGTSIDPNSGIVKCGRPGMKMCTLCDLIAGLNKVIHYIMEIAIGVALLAMAIGGVLYVVSAGESAMMEMAKKAITNAAIGFVIVFAAWLIVNTTITFLGAKPDLGINVTGWGNFVCTAPVVVSPENVGATTTANNAITGTQSTLVENDPCVQSQAPYCKDGLSCTGGKCVPKPIATTTIQTGGCCVGPGGSYQYTKCFDGATLLKQDCHFMTAAGVSEDGDYVANARCKDIIVGNTPRKACQ